MPEGAMVSTDIGNICSVSNSYLRFDRPRSMLAAMSFGNCGYAFPTIVGAKVAAPDRPAIAYVGDGAWGMSFGEIQTCVRENIPVTAVVFNNGQWGAEKKNHVDFYENRFVGVNLDKQPSWAKVAQAMGAEGADDRQARRRRPGAARGREGAGRGQDHDPRDDGDARAGRSVPPRRARAADAPSREVPVDGREAPLSGDVGVDRHDRALLLPRQREPRAAHPAGGARRAVRAQARRPRQRGAQVARVPEAQPERADPGAGRRRSRAVRDGRHLPASRGHASGGGARAAARARPNARISTSGSCGAPTRCRRC